MINGGHNNYPEHDRTISILLSTSYNIIETMIIFILNIIE